RYQPYVEQSVDQLLARFDRAQGKEKELLHDLVKMGGWGPAQLYFRLSPADRSVLMSGSALRYSMDDSNPDRRLPAEWRIALLKSTGLAYFPTGTIIQPKAAPDKPSTPIDRIPGAQPTVMLSLDRSEAGEFSLEV